MSETLPFSVDRAEGPVWRFVLHGELDLIGASDLEEAAAGCPVGADVIFDLRSLTFVDSSGINAFIRLARRIGPGRVVLEGPAGQVRRVLDLVGLEGLANVEVIDPQA